MLAAWLQEPETLATREQFWLALCEEMWDGEDSVPDAGCTDIVARGKAVADGGVLVGHNNDESGPGVATVFRVAPIGKPAFLAIGLDGVTLSVGFNERGLSLTGNALTATDVRPGIPRLLTTRAALEAERIGDAIDVCLNPKRASSYNNVLVDPSGEVYSVEGSATDAVTITPTDDLLAHANHYATLALRNKEGRSISGSGNSLVRQHRAMRLLREGVPHIGESFRRILSDHVNYPESICRHGDDVKSRFCVIADVAAGSVAVAFGNPCSSVFRVYSYR
jgi:isopenicillin-N N-acyltransferase-like protein